MSLHCHGDKFTLINQKIPSYGIKNPLYGLSETFTLVIPSGGISTITWSELSLVLSETVIPRNLQSV